mmetsp:Transcript_67/g.234  ORF Transcript_67/g.234 Transcript_67/m.234 type:complete len:240 (-) Transcript_67:697-1416(-)
MALFLRPTAIKQLAPLHADPNVSIIPKEFIGPERCPMRCPLQLDRHSAFAEGHDWNLRAVGAMQRLALDELDDAGLRPVCPAAIKGCSTLSTNPNISIVPNQSIGYQSGTKSPLLQRYSNFVLAKLFQPDNAAVLCMKVLACDHFESSKIFLVCPMPLEWRLPFFTHPNISVIPEERATQQASSICGPSQCHLQLVLAEETHLGSRAVWANNGTSLDYLRHFFVYPMAIEHFACLLPPS